MLSSQDEELDNSLEQVQEEQQQGSYLNVDGFDVNMLRT